MTPLRFLAGVLVCLAAYSARGCMAVALLGFVAVLSMGMSGLKPGGAIASGTGALVSFADPSPTVSAHPGDGHLSQVRP